MDPVRELISFIHSCFSKHWKFQKLRYVGVDSEAAEDSIEAIFKFNICKVLVLEDGRIIVESKRYRRSLSPLDFPESDALVRKLLETLKDFDLRYPDFEEGDYKNEFASLERLVSFYSKQGIVLRVLIAAFAFVAMFLVYRYLGSLESWIKVPLLLAIIVAMSLLRRHIGF